MRATPRIRLNMWSSMRVKAKIAMVDTTINVSNIGQSRFQVTLLLIRHTMTAEVVMARSPERVVASPYVGRKSHNEDAKAEAGSALHKTGPDAQQEYGYHNTTHHFIISQYYHIRSRKNRFKV